MSDTAIKFENISKQYRLGVVNTGTLSHDLKRWWAINMRGKEDPYLKIGSVNDRSIKADSDYVWALRDINFEVKQGEVLGIIGKNGAGKSTLLKILSRVTSPTTGRISAHGRIASLLEVGTGFHPEMTGRENIYMNGSIMGMSKSEINRKLDEIVDFAGIEKYIDTPVKRYSSGMTVRLGFAIAAHLEPEILVVDEVLAVGDAEFQKKAIGKMQDVSKGKGRTVLFVSHNMAAIKRLCGKGLLLTNGEINFHGSIDDTVKKYLTFWGNGQLKYFIRFDNTNKEVQVIETSIVDENNLLITSSIDIYSPIYVNIKYLFNQNVGRVHLTLLVSNEEGELIIFCDRRDEYKDWVSVDKGEYETKLRIPNPLLLPGKYSITIGCASVDSNVNDHKYDVLTFEISNISSGRIEKRQGYVYIPLKWDLNKVIK